MTKKIFIIILMLNAVAFPQKFEFLFADGDTIAIPITSILFFADSGRVIFDTDTSALDTGRYIIPNFLAFLDTTFADTGAMWDAKDSLLAAHFFRWGDGNLYNVRIQTPGIIDSVEAIIDSVYGYLHIAGNLEAATAILANSAGDQVVEIKSPTFADGVYLSMEQGASATDRLFIAKYSDDHSTYPDAVGIVNYVGGTAKDRIVLYPTGRIYLDSDTTQIKTLLYGAFNLNTSGWLASGAPFYMKDSSSTNRAIINYTAATKDYLTFGNSLFPTIIKGGNTTNAIYIDDGLSTIDDVYVNKQLEIVQTATGLDAIVVELPSASTDEFFEFYRGGRTTTNLLSLLNQDGQLYTPKIYFIDGNYAAGTIGSIYKNATVGLETDVAFTADSFRVGSTTQWAFKTIKLWDQTWSVPATAESANDTLLLAYGYGLGWWPIGVGSDTLAVRVDTTEIATKAYVDNSGGGTETIGYGNLKSNTASNATFQELDITLTAGTWYTLKFESNGPYENTTVDYTNSRIQVADAGTYFVTAQISLEWGYVTGLYTFALYDDSSIFSTLYVQAAASTESFTVSGTVTAAANSYFYFKLKPAGAYDGPIYGCTNMTVMRLD